jgi:hypothetical protein
MVYLLGSYPPFRYAINRFYGVADLYCGRGLFPAKNDREKTMSNQKLIDALRPERIKSSGLMHFIIGRIVGAQWVTHERDMGAGFSITSDSHVISSGIYIGTAEEFKRNVTGYIETAELSPELTAEFWELYDTAVTDFRNPS